MTLRARESGFGLLYPNVLESRKLRDRKKANTGATDNTSGPAAAAAESEAAEKQYNWPQRDEKYVIGLGMGLDENVYPAINQCQGSQNDESRAIPRLLNELLSNCNAGVTLPDGSDRRYVGQLRAIEWTSGQAQNTEMEI